MAPDPTLISQVRLIKVPLCIAWGVAALWLTISPKEFSKRVTFGRAILGKKETMFFRVLGLLNLWGMYNLLSGDL